MNEEQISATDNPETKPPSDAARTANSNLERAAKEAVHATKAELAELKDSARRQASTAVDEIKSAATTTARQAREAGRDFVHEQKESLAKRVNEYAEAVRAASEKLGTEEGNLLATPAQKTADRLEQVSNYLREKEPADLLDDLDSFARQKPEVFFGGFFIAGFAAARFLKASRKRPRHERAAQGETDQLSAAAPPLAPSPVPPPTPTSIPPQPVSTSPVV